MDFLDDINKLNETLYKRDEEIKKLMQDKIELLEKLVELHELMEHRPFFLPSGTFQQKS